MKLSPIYLKNNEERRILAGHLWVYSNEIDTQKSALQKYQQGELVAIYTHSGKRIGIGYINPKNLICVRLLSRDGNEEINVGFFVRRIQKALQLRDKHFTHPYYRLCFADSDDLPGLIVDRYKDVLVAQINTAGMENLKSLICEALVEVLKPKGILWKNDSSMREMEGLTKYVEVAYGTVPQQVVIKEHGCKFEVPLWKGQKTGWFFDQSYNRSRLQNYVKNADVLDVCSYIGAWAIQAAIGGAKSVTCIDSSEFALACLQKNAELNNVVDKIKPINQDVFIALAKLASEKNIFDLIILDPPAFIKKRKDIKEGMQAYARLIEMALRLLAPQGVLFITSCSLHMHKDMLFEVVRKAAVSAKRSIKIVEQLHQAQDHPVNPAILETDYLKGFVIND